VTSAIGGAVPGQVGSLSVIGGRSFQFSETLRNQISERRGNPSSVLSTFVSPNLSSPVGLTFGGGSTFEVGNVDLSGPFSLHCRPLGDYQRVKGVNMVGAASVRSSIEQNLIDSPVIDISSPLDHSKISTPAAGFSVRGTFGRTKSNFDSLTSGNEGASEWVYPS
jgi:hypothetical protein